MITVKLDSVEMNKTSKTGQVGHVLKYNYKGGDRVNFVSAESNVGRFIKPELAGKDVELTFFKNETTDKFELGKLVQAGGAAPSAGPKPFTKSFQPNPDKDLSMELGGLMHDVATIIGSGKIAHDLVLEGTLQLEVEGILKSLYLAKKEVTRKIKSGEINKKPEVVKPTPTVESTAEVYEVGDGESF